MSRGSSLILVENLSVPFDRRVWQEATTLVQAGYDVTVVCPAGRNRDTAAFEEREGVQIHRFPLEPATGGPKGYAKEYGKAFAQFARHVRRLARDTHFDVVHACNPPDLIFLAALPLKFRSAFLFDHHDLIPELYLSRFDRGKDALYRGTILAERLTFALADVVISTNESYRDVALERGRKRPDRVFVVRSAPELSRFVPRDPVDERRHGREHLLAYVGVMGPQDGVDHALRALAHLRESRGDWHATFVGSGDVWEEMQSLASSLGLDDVVDFPGRVSDEELIEIVSSADVCLSPDPWNPLNDVSTMNKVVEYMALGKPMVSYELREARVSAGPAAVYVTANDERAFADGIDELLDDPQRRAEMGRAGQERVRADLAWGRSAERLLEAYDVAMSVGRKRSKR